MSSNRLFDVTLKNTIQTTLQSSWKISEEDADELIAAFANQLPEFYKHLNALKKNSFEDNVVISYTNPDLTLNSNQASLVKAKLSDYRNIHSLLIDPWYEAVTEEFIDKDNIKIFPDFISKGQEIIYKALMENDNLDGLQPQLLAELGIAFPGITPEAILTIFNNDLFDSFIELKQVFQENFLLSMDEIKNIFAPELLNPDQINRLKFDLNELYDIALTKKYDYKIHPQSFTKEYQKFGLAALWDDDNTVITSGFDFGLIRSENFLNFLLDIKSAGTLHEQQKVILKKSLQESLLISESQANQLLIIFHNQLPALQEHIQDIQRDYIFQPTQSLITKYQNPILVMTQRMNNILNYFFTDHLEMVYQLNSMFRIDRRKAFSLMTSTNMQEILDFINIVKKTSADAIQNKAFIVGLSHSIFATLRRNSTYIEIGYISVRFDNLDDNYLPKLKDANDALQNTLLLTKQERIDYLSKLNVDQVARLPLIIQAIKSEAMRRIQLSYRENIQTDYSKFGVAIFSPFETHNFPILNAPKFMGVLSSLPLVNSKLASGVTLSEAQLAKNNEQLIQGFDRLAQGQPIGQLQLASLPDALIEPDIRVLNNLFIVASAATLIMAVALFWLRSLRNPTGRLALAQDVAMLTPGFNIILNIESQALPEINFLTESEIANLKKYIETKNDPEFKAKLQKYEDFLNDICSISLTARKDLEDPVSVEILKLCEHNGVPRTSFYMSTYEKEEFLLWLGSRFGATDPVTRDKLISNHTQSVKITRGFPVFIKSFVKLAKNTLNLNKPLDAQHGELEIRVDSVARRQP